MPAPRKRRPAKKTADSDPQDAAIESAVGSVHPTQKFEEQKQRDLHAAREKHNARTGGGTVTAGEVDAARQAHNERVSSS